MPIGQSYNVALRYAKESTWGATPSAALKELRYTTESLVSEKDYQRSADIIQERRVRELLNVGTQSTGGMEFELSYANLDDLLEGALANTWSTDTPSSGTDTLTDGSTLTSFTLEKEYTDLSTPEFYTFTGCRIGAFSLNVEPDNPITASVSMMGKGGSVSESTAGTGSATAAPTNDVMVVGAHVSSFKEGGTTSSDEITSVLSFTLDLENNLRNQRAIATLDPHNIAIGRVNVTGTINVYFEDSTYIDKYENETDTSLQLTVADDASNQYLIDLFNVRYTVGSIPHQGTDGDAIVELEYEAIRDSSEGTVISIERS